MSAGLTRATLVLGGARSGKTGHGMALAEAAASERLYIATAQAFDDEMADRIARHKAERGAGWSTLEAPVEITEGIRGATGVVLVDCLTLWLSNLMHAERDIADATTDLLEAIRASRATVVLVSNEVGLGIVPETPLGRAFRDAQGRLNQDVAAAVGQVQFVAAGLPLTLKRS